MAPKVVRANTLNSRVAECLVEYLFLRSGYRVQRIAAETTDPPSTRSSKQQGLAPSFRISRRRLNFEIAIKVTGSGYLTQKEQRAVEVQCRRQPSLCVILVHTSYPENPDDHKDFNPYEVWESGEHDWILVHPENGPFYPDAEAVSAAIDVWRALI